MLDKVMNMFFKIFEGIILSIDKYSFEICLLVGLVAAILYVFGYKKGLRVATIAPGVYVILQIFLEVWFGV